MSDSVRAPSGESAVQNHEAEIARLTEQVEEWSRQNLAIIALEVKERKRADEAERQLEEAHQCKLALEEESARLSRELAEARVALKEVEIAIEQAARLRGQLADANAHVAALTAALETRRSACNEESERADEARGQLGAEHAAHLATGRWLADTEQQLADARAALRDLVETLVCRVDIQPLLGLREYAQISRALAALKGGAPAEGEG